MLRSYKSSLLVLPAILLAGLYINTNVFADSNDVDFSITVNPSLTLALSSNTVNFSITPTAQGAYNSANFTVTSATNNAYGYTLVMGTSDVDLTSNTINPTTGTEPTIPTLTETQDGISAAAFEASTDSTVLNHYGVAIGTGNNFNAMKTTKQVKKTTTNNASGVDNTIITLASKLDLATVPGTYSTTLNFQITANPLPGGLEEAYQNAEKSKKTINGKEYYAMQDMNSTICSNATVEDDQIQVYDNRDDKIYWIAKLKDGHCWMTQNLDLDLVTVANGDPLYNHDNTDLGWGSDSATTSWNPENETIAVSGSSFPNWTYDNNVPYSADPGNWYWSGSYSSTSCNYLSTTCADFTASPVSANGTHGHIGNYYNWTAAIASNDSTSMTSGNASNSVCPAGWRLPMGGDSGEFATLNTYYGNTTSTDIDLVSDPLFFVRGGYVWAGRLENPGYYGYYWSSTVRSSTDAHYFDFTAYGVYPAGRGTRNQTFALRCVAR